MSNYLVDDADLTSVADAIRAKSGGSSTLAFPSGFVSEIQAIPTGGGPHEVPSGYTQLKFLQSSGTQWIKTSVVPTLETQMQVTGQRFVTSGYNAIAGSYNPTIYCPMNNGVYAQRYYIVFGNSGEKNIDQPFPVGTAFPPTFTVNKTKATFDTYGMAQKSANIGATAMGGTDQNTRIALFGRYNGTTDVCTCTACIIFRVKFWENDMLIGDYVPAKRDADDVLGMYDIVNDVFYTNAGTGDFIGGEYE